jgi:hypothetical protein
MMLKDKMMIRKKCRLRIKEEGGFWFVGMRKEKIRGRFVMALMCLIRLLRGLTTRM